MQAESHLKDQGYSRQTGKTIKASEPMSSADQSFLTLIGICNFTKIL